jgi:general secretion pathway protein F
MGVYQYKALTQDGREISGSLDYPEEQSVLIYLESQGFIPVDIEKSPDKGDTHSDISHSLKREHKKFSVIDFTNGMSMLLRAGLPVDKSLTSLIAATNDKGSRHLLEQVEREIREGSSLSKALRQYEKLFGSLYLSMVLAGEVSGNLDASIQQLSVYLEAQKELKDRIVNAMIYPIILLVVTLMSIVILMVVVMPKFKQLFEDMGGELPAITKAFVSASDFMQEYGLVIGLVIISLAPVILYLRNNKEFSALIDRAVLKLPWIGDLINKIQMARYAETLSMMMKCGIPIQKTLEISKSVVTNSWIRRQLSVSAERLKEGGTFSLTIGGHFPVLTQQMLKIGEEAGELGNTLSKIATISEQNVNRDIHRVISILEPLIIVVLGVIVAAVIGSIMVAVLGMNDLISI